MLGGIAYLLRNDETDTLILRDLKHFTRSIGHYDRCNEVFCVKDGME